MADLLPPARRSISLMQRATGDPAAEENGRLRVWLFLVLVHCNFDI